MILVRIYMEQQHQTPPTGLTPYPETEKTSPEHTKHAVYWRRQHREGLKFFVILLVAAVCGFVGGSTAPFFTDMLEKQLPFLSPSLDRAKNKAAALSENQQPGRREVSSFDDDVIVNLVERNAPGVVSIVVSKDIPAVRNFFQNPFFFDPFYSQDVPPDARGDGRSNTKRQIGSGSGFLVSSDGLIVTNRHVVADTSAEYTVVTNDGKEHMATVLARDPVHDIAVLKIDGNELPDLDLGDSDQIKVGQTVIAIGNPLGEFENSVTRGIISGLKREVSAGSGFGRSEQLSGILQTDAAINPGNSGGPLFNLSGEVIGVNVAMAQGAENIAFALPINQVKRIVDQVKTTGKISTPYLGLRYLILTPALAKENNLPVDYGALIIRGQRTTDFAVIPGSPADKAGLVENDIVLEIDGTAIDERHPLASLIAEKNVGDTITLKVWHKGETKSVTVRLEERQ